MMPGKKQRSQAPYHRRYVGIDYGHRHSHGGYSGSGWRETCDSGIGRTFQTVVGDFCGCGLQAMRFAELGDATVRLDFTTGVAFGEREGFCDTAKTLDCRADVCMDRQVSSKREGLRTKHQFQQGNDPHRHDRKNAQIARKTQYDQLKTYSNINEWLKAPGSTAQFVFYFST